MFQIEGTSYSVRPATEDDLAAILEIEKRSYKLPWSKEAFTAEIHKPFSEFLLITDDETDSQVVGYIVYWLLFEECHILNVAVHPDFRGIRVATNLVRQAITAAMRKDMKRVFLEVRKSNNPAVALYQKLGFFVDHIKKSFYEDGEDAYFMIFFLDKKNQF